MAILGLPYRIIYEAKDLRSGLVDVFARIRKPNGVWIGPFPLTEESDPSMAGIYTYNLSTALADPEGEWYGHIDSPTENHRVGIRISFSRSSGSGGTIDIGCPKLVGRIRLRRSLLGRVSKTTFKAILKSKRIQGTVMTTPIVQGKIKSNRLTGRILCKTN